MPLSRYHSRKISAGNVTIAANTTVVVTTVTRNQNECVRLDGFLVDSVAGARWSEQGGFFSINDEVFAVLQRTGNNNEFDLLMRNNNLISGPSRTMDWILMATIK